MTALPVTRIACDALHCTSEHHDPVGSGPDGWVHLPGRENPDGRTGRDYCPDHAARVHCNYCGVVVQQSQGSINRATRQGRPIYCDRACAGMARRVDSSEKKNAKRIYDAQRRIELAAQISAKKAEYYRRTRNPARERARRQETMGRHVEYCRQPEYVAYKAEYDQERRAKEYGEFGDAYLLLLDLEREIRSRASSYERRKARGYYTRSAQQRRRELWLATTGN